MKKKQTRRELFLSEMEAVVPWGRLLRLITPHYPKAGPKGGRPPMPIETMLRVYFLQNWYARLALDFGNGEVSLAKCPMASVSGHLFADLPKLLPGQSRYH